MTAHSALSPYSAFFFWRPPQPLWSWITGKPRPIKKNEVAGSSDLANLKKQTPISLTN
jgi:hypothetical protein